MTYSIQIFDERFFFDSYSSRKRKGVHAAMKRMDGFVRKVGENGRRRVWVLHGDVENYFASIHQDTLIILLRRVVSDEVLFWLCEEIIRSYGTTPGVGLPLGNLTSQLFSNVYLHELDRFMQDVDFLGSVLFSWGKAPRRRVCRRMREPMDWRTRVSYLGLLGHARGFVLRERLRLEVEFKNLR